MKYLQDIIWSPESFDEESPRRLESNPFANDIALRESQIIDVTVSAVTATVGILLEFRTAIEFDEGNAAVLVARGLRNIEYSATPRNTQISAWTVLENRIEIRSEYYKLQIKTWPDSCIDLSARRLEFYVVEIDGIDHVPPDYGFDSEDKIRSQLPHWDSRYTLLQAGLLDWHGTT